MLNLIGLDVHDFWFCWDFVISSLLSWGQSASFPSNLGIMLFLLTLNLPFVNNFFICQGYHGSVSKFYFQHWSWWLTILATLKWGKMFILVLPKCWNWKRKASAASGLLCPSSISVECLCLRYCCKGHPLQIDTGTWLVKPNASSVNDQSMIFNRNFVGNKYSYSFIRIHLKTHF